METALAILIIFGLLVLFFIFEDFFEGVMLVVTIALAFVFMICPMWVAERVTRLWRPAKASSGA